MLDGDNCHYLQSKDSSTEASERQAKIPIVALGFAQRKFLAVRLFGKLLGIMRALKSLTSLSAGHILNSIGQHHPSSVPAGELYRRVCNFAELVAF